MQELAPGIFVETGFRRVNVGAILTDEGFVLIDTPPYPEDARRWRAILATISERPIRAIINTDAHTERVLGNYWFHSDLIVAHDETAQYLKNVPNNFIDTAIDTLTSYPFERSQFSSLQLCTPNISFSDRMQLRIGGKAIPMLAKSGPMDGSLWVHLPDERLVFTGDSVIVDQHPHIASGCTKQWLENLTVLRRTRFQADTIVPGRGSLTDKSATEPISSYLRLARRRVSSLYNAGRPRADTSTLVPELLALFPYDAGQLDIVQRRIKNGLDRIYEEFKADDKDDEN